MTVPPAPDAARSLVAGLRAGDRDAKRHLFETEGETVWRVAYRLSGDGDIADDVTQETFLRAFRMIGTYGGRGSLRGWLCRIALNVYRDERRTARRRSSLLAARGAELSEASPEVGTSSEPASPVVRVLDGLPEKYRVVIVMHDLEGLTHDEIGEALGIAQGSSRARLSRARSMVRQRLAAAPHGGD